MRLNRVVFFIGENMRLIKFSNNKNKPTTNRLKEIGNDGSSVFVDYDAEKDSLNRPKKINDYRNMLKDGTVEALFNIITMPILASEYSIEPEDESEAAKLQADFVRNNLLSENYRGGIETPFDLFLDQAMMALIDGFQVWEKVYRLNGEYLELKKLALRDSRSLEIIKDSKVGYNGVKQLQDNGHTIEIPAYKTFLFTHGKRYDALYGRSMFTALWRNYDKKWKLEYLDSIALQNDAIKPKILKRIGNGVTLTSNDGVISKALRTLGRLGKINSVASLPENYEVEVLNSDGRDPHQSIERQNSEMARTFLANFMLLGTQGTSSTGSFALSDTQSKIFRMSLESIMNNLASSINQYIIADLIDINFAEAHYPTFKFQKLDNDVVSAVFNAFTTLIQKDRISDAMASEIEDATAVRLGFDIEKIKQQRESQQQPVKVSENRPQLCDCGHNHSHKLSDNAHEMGDDMKKLDSKWQELERRFLAQIRPVYEAVAEELAGQIISAKSLDEIKQVELPVEYRRTLVSFFKQGYQVGKISVSDELGAPAPKTNSALTKAAVEYISWIIDKQQDDLTNYAKELVMSQVVLDDETNDRRSRIVDLILTWFTTKLISTASYMIAQSVNSGRNSMWNDNDLLRYSAILDSRTSAWCNALDGKVMTWREWRANPDYIPPKHFNCRSTFVKISDQTPRNDITPPDDDAMTEIKRIQQTPKSELIKDGTLQGKMTKKGLLEMKSSEFGLPAKGKISLNEALTGTNPNYVKGVRNEYSTNCQRCVPTYEMRRRGYNVEALPNTGDGLGSLSMIAKMWGLNKNDEHYISPKLLVGGVNKTVDYNQEYTDWFKFIDDMPSGARVQVGWVWKDSRVGHTIMAEKKADKLVFIDPQIQSIKKRDEFVADVKARPRHAFWAFRVDNRELDKEMIKLIMKESK